MKSSFRHLFGLALLLPVIARASPIGDSFLRGDLLAETAAGLLSTELDSGATSDGLGGLVTTAVHSVDTVQEPNSLLLIGLGLLALGLFSRARRR